MSTFLTILAGLAIMLVIYLFLRWGTSLSRSNQKPYSALPDYDEYEGRVRDASNVVQKGEPQNIRGDKS